MLGRFLEVGWCSRFVVQEALDELPGGIVYRLRGQLVTNRLRVLLEATPRYLLHWQQLYLKQIFYSRYAEVNSHANPSTYPLLLLI